MVAVEVHHRGLREPVDRVALDGLVGRRIERLRRRAKYLLIDVDGDLTLVVHLGMSGQLTVVEESAPRALHEHVTFRLEGSRRLRFVDPRRFGLVVVLATSTLAADRRFARLGPEPLEGNLSGQMLAEAALGRRASAKSYLMNPQVVVGVGNIYASEVLHRAGVHPCRSVRRIGVGSWERVAASVRDVLAEAIAAGGTSVSDYVDGDGRRGSFQRALEVYGRKGERCGRCDGTVRRIVQAGRSTYYCPRCQR